ncbi:perforin-1-like [Aplochiton taeniatus]
MTVGGTHSRAARNVMEKSKKDKYSFIKQEVQCSYYSYRLKDDPPLHPEFSRSLGLLPALYTDQTKADYTRFLSTFGTHFIRKVSLGGQVKSLTSVRVCQAALDGYTETEVKDCLEAEASAASHTGNAELRAETKFCKNDLKKRNSKDSFSSTFNERLTQVVGGQTDGASDLLFSAKNNPTAFSEWMKSLKTLPDITRYSLQPLHLLVKPTNRRQSLKKAVEDYIMENSLIQRCSQECTGGSSSSSRDKCQCVCQANKEVTSQCCPQERGLAHLTVTVKHATDLWGDTLSKTDGFVKIQIDEMKRQTKVIYNNDNPRWDESMYFGTVKVSLSSELKMEVCDEDKLWIATKNDLLGSCVKSITMGNHEEVCPLKHGNLYFSYQVKCAPGLGGPTCSEYVPSAMPPDLRDLYTSRHSLNVTQDLLAHLRMGHGVDDPLTFVVKQREDKGKVKVHPRLPALNEL